MTRGRLRPRRWPLLLLSFVAVLIGGCVGHPDVDGAAAPLAFEVTVERSRWEHAPPGCEDLAGEGLLLAGCEGAPGLAALLDLDGRVRCVDAAGLLAYEAHTMSTIAPVAGDPSPQPNRPPPPEMESSEPSMSSR